jgi:hypothetical protein
MKRFQMVVVGGVLSSMLVGLSGCRKEITIQCHSETTNLKVGDETIGYMAAGAQEDVEIKGLGRTLVKWTNYDGEAESETIYGEDVEDGAVWHLYYGYGSFDEW